MDGFKPIDRVKEYGIKNEKVETSEFPNEPKWHFVDNGKGVIASENNRNEKMY